MPERECCHTHTHAHHGVLKEVVLLLVLLEEEDVVVLPRPRAVHKHNVLVVLQLALCKRVRGRG